MTRNRIDLLKTISEKLMPCPCCGAKPEIERPFSRVIKVFGLYFDIPLPIWVVRCSEMCDGYSKNIKLVWARTKKDAIREWNRRATDEH
jgi:hypothetical protein